MANLPVEVLLAVVDAAPELVALTTGPVLLLAVDGTVGSPLALAANLHGRRFLETERAMAGWFPGLRRLRWLFRAGFGRLLVETGGHLSKARAGR